jgi:septal ring factor EnvC (AmiA/AmiB activator)
MARVGISTFIAALLLVSSSSFAAKKMTISDIRKSIRFQNRSLNRINKRIISLESKLGKKNKDYIQILDNKRFIETKIFKGSEKIQQYISFVANEKTKTKKLLGSVVANSMSNEETSSDILSKKLLSKMLNEKLLKLQSLEDVLKGKKHRLAQLNTKFHKLEKKELEILSFISELEERKKEYAAQYVSTEKQKLELSGKLSSIKSKISQNKKSKKRKYKKPSLNIKFSSPIQLYSGLEYEKKGITFKFKDRQPVKTTLAGVVNHVGTLANYGNVLMIDHGKGIRSIFLGNFSSKIRKGQKIKAGQIVGHTLRKKSDRELGKLYFEIRKKNVAQNTFLLMDKKFFAKNNLDTVNI